MSCFSCSIAIQHIMIIFFSKTTTKLSKTKILKIKINLFSLMAQVASASTQSAIAVVKENNNQLTKKQMSTHAANTINSLLSKLTFNDNNNSMNPLMRKLGLGLVGAVQVCMVLVFVMVLAAAIGVGLVQLWVEEPVYARENLFFDYTQFNPNAHFSFNHPDYDRRSYNNKVMLLHQGVPVGHTFHISLRLLMPDSDFNRYIGVFQVNAELLSKKGDVIGKSSQPCMLRYRSFPLRLVRTFFMGGLILMGISSETQTIALDILTHKEGHPRSEAIRVTLIPRAGTSYLPQLYGAEMVMKSRLPWTKQLVHNWKWTLSVWMSIYVYILFLIILFCFFRQLFFQGTRTDVDFDNVRNLIHDGIETEEQRGTSSAEKENNIVDLLRIWKRNRSKRKAVFLRKAFPENVGSSADSMSLTREDTRALVEEDVGDSESVCLDG